MAAPEPGIAAAQAPEGATLIERLEFFFTGPEFTTAIGEFAGEHAVRFTVIDLEAEQPLEYHDIYSQYTALIDAQLDTFLVREGLSAAEVLEACSEAAETDDGATTCLDYLLASSEYDYFLGLMADFRRMYGLDEAAEQQPGGRAPEEEAFFDEPLGDGEELEPLEAGPPEALGGSGSDSDDGPGGSHAGRSAKEGLSKKGD